MRSILVGTAGHVDHGKTALVRALTGIDCDRLEEEKRRGITLDLGFAHLAPDPAGTADPVELSFVDVPGHERFLHNALAGLGGVRLLLLVVAADEGIRAQTREHLAIAELLELPGLVVALNKVDNVDRELVELAELELAELLAGTRFAGSPILRVSALSGAGVAELGAALQAAARALAAPVRDDEPARLPVDRAFLLKGHGLVVTGTIVSGVIAAGDLLELLPARRPARVRSVEVHGRPRTALGGERAALQISGIELGEVARGMELAAPGALRTTRRLLVRWRRLAGSPVALELAPITVRVHLYASETLGTARFLAPVAATTESPGAPASLAPGASALVEIALAKPVVAARGDRFIVRRPSPAATLGGGTVLDPWWRRKRRGDPGERLAALAGDGTSTLLAWAGEAGERGLTAAAAAARTGRSRAHLTRELAALAAAGQLLRLDRSDRSDRSEAGAPARYLRPQTLEHLRHQAREALARYFTAHPLALGLSKAEAVRLLLPPAARGLADLYFARLAALGDLELVADEVRLPGRGAEPPAALSPLARTLVERYDAAGLAPPSPGEVARELAAKPQIVEGLIQHLVKRRELARLPAGLIVATAALARLEADLRATGWERFTIAQFKERFGLSRKWAIPLLEHLDSTGVTRRLGEERQIRPPAGPSKGLEPSPSR